MLMLANELLNRAKHEYLEMPGLVLTSRQASRLWNLDPGGARCCCRRSFTRSSCVRRVEGPISVATDHRV